MEDLYLREGGTIKTVARELGVSNEWVSGWLDDYGIEKKTLAGRLSVVPTSVVAPVLQKLMDEWETSPLLPETSAAGEPHKKKKGRQEENPWRRGRVEVIASSMPEAVKVSTRRISGILRQEQRNVSWVTVDKLLCFFEKPYLWYTDPGLREFYWENNDPPEDWERLSGLVSAIAGLR
jgi:transposase-like protein